MKLWEGVCLQLHRVGDISQVLKALLQLSHDGLGLLQEPRRLDCSHDDV